MFYISYLPKRHAAHQVFSQSSKLDGCKIYFRTEYPFAKHRSLAHSVLSCIYPGGTTSTIKSYELPDALKWYKEMEEEEGGDKIDSIAFFKVSAVFKARFGV